jgi:hypothetical protein
MPPLHEACRRGDATAVAQLITEGVDVNVISPVASDWNPASPLHHAADSGGGECVRLLLTTTDANTELLDHFGSTPLHWAADVGNTECVRQLLLGGANKEAQTPFVGARAAGGRALHYAVRSAHEDCVRLLLDAGAAAEAKDNHGDTPLQWGSHHPAMVKILTDWRPAQQPAPPGDGTTKERTVAEMAGILKEQLGLPGAALHEVVDAACEQVGVPTEGKFIMQKAREACEACEAIGVV